MDKIEMSGNLTTVRKLTKCQEKSCHRKLFVATMFGRAPVIPEHTSSVIFLVVHFSVWFGNTWLVCYRKFYEGMLIGCGIINSVNWMDVPWCLKLHFLVEPMPITQKQYVEHNSTLYMMNECVSLNFEFIYSKFWLAATDTENRLCGFWN